MLGYLRRRTDPATAEDLAAETFLVAWSRIEKLPDHEAGWLCGIARNLLANHNRAIRRRSENEQRNYRLEAPLGDDTAVDHVLGHDGEVLRALRRLSPADQEVLMLVAWDGLSHAEAAAALGCARPTFAVRLHRARRRMARQLAAGSEQITIVARTRVQGANGE